MAAAYDQYDYPAYWQERKYEHESEVLALNTFLNRIPKVKSILEIGAGFGRLTPYYRLRAQKIILSDPSAKHLKAARKKYPDFKYVQSTIEKLPEKLVRSRFDLVILVRVTHHLENIDTAFNVIEKLLNKKGYLILEFPNKLHGKAIISNFLKGNFTFPLEIFPFDKRSKKAKQAKTLPFFNYHPAIIEQKLEERGLTIIEKRSVSNIRNSFLKRNIPIGLLLSLEKTFQILFSSLNFGPSIFILAQKRDK